MDRISTADQHWRVNIDSPEITQLTPHECEVLTLVAQGMCNREIANCLHLSEKTVRNRVSEILSKLDVSNRTQAALWAKEHGLS